MSTGEKILAVGLSIILIGSLIQLFNKGIRFPVFSEKGVYAEGFVGHIRAINPAFIDFSDADRDVSRLVFSGLIKYDPVQKNFLPDLAEKWNVSKNGLIYTFTLRKNALWHDGQPLTANDIVFTFQNVFQHPAFRNPILRNSFEGIEVKKLDDYTVSFTLTKQNSYFIANLLVGILPKHILENADISSLDKSQFSKKYPIGSGPYKITSLKLDNDGDIVDLEAFSEYYGEKPAMKLIRLFTFPDEKSLLKDKGALHAISKLNATQIFSESNFSTYNYSLNQFTALHFNTENQFLKEKKVRQALAQALNKQELIMEGEKRVDSLGLTDRSAEPLFKFDPESAKKTLDEINLNKSEPVSLNLLTLNIEPLTLTDAIKRQMENIGVKIEVERVGSADFYDYVSQKRYDLLLIRHNLGYTRDIYSLLHSSQTIDPDKGSFGLNFSNFRSFKTDGLTEALRKERNPPDKEKLLAQLSVAITDEIPLVFISTPIYTFALDKNIQSLSLPNLNSHSDRWSFIPYLKLP